MQKNVIVWDLICYMAFPLIIWKFGREFVGDYYAMLISSVPGIIYSGIRFYLTKSFNFLGIYLICRLAIGTLIDVLAGSAIQLLWNNVYFAYASGCLFLFSLILRKPLVLYFFVDIAVMQGYDRQESKKMFHQPNIYSVLCLLTLVTAMQDILLASIKVWFINEYGVEAFDKGIILRQAINWVFSAACLFGFWKIYKLTKEYNENRTLVEE